MATWDELRLNQHEHDLYFATDVVYMPPLGLHVPLKGVWDTGPVAREDSGAGTDRFAGKLWIRLADLPGVEKNGLFLIAGVTYRIANMPADDRDIRDGTVWLHLRRL